MIISNKALLNINLWIKKTISFILIKVTILYLTLMNLSLLSTKKHRISFGIEDFKKTTQHWMRDDKI